MSGDSGPSASSRPGLARGRREESEAAVLRPGGTLPACERCHVWCHRVPPAWAHGSCTHVGMTMTVRQSFLPAVPLHPPPPQAGPSHPSRLCSWLPPPGSREPALISPLWVSPPDTQRVPGKGALRAASGTVLWEPQMLGRGEPPACRASPEFACSQLVSGRGGGGPRGGQGPAGSSRGTLCSGGPQRKSLRVPEKRTLCVDPWPLRFCT